ncbi:9688_t:CDS:2, partial [Entrophospora sp. SA101]
MGTNKYNEESNDPNVLEFWDLVKITISNYSYIEYSMFVDKQSKQFGIKNNK